MAQVTLTIGVHRKWWVLPSLYLLSVFCKISGRSPDIERLAAWYGLHGFDMIVDGKRIRLGCL